VLQQELEMTYPQAPWTLQGYAIHSWQFLDVERVRPFIPPEFEIISILPGKTVGGVYVSHYGSGSVLEYDELIVTGGLVSDGSKFGAWISHIYVDNVDSVAGGREIWGLPKELAEFTWEPCDRATSGYDHRLIVRQGERILCQWSYNSPNFGLPLPFSGDAFSTQYTSILRFNSRLKSSISLIGSQLQVPAESPFADLGVDRPWLTLYSNELDLEVAAPKVVGYKKTELKLAKSS
jgi:hypothetical protein